VAAVAPLLIFVAVAICGQAFGSVKKKHMAAVAMAMIPHVGDIIYKKVCGAAGATGTEIVIGTNWRFEEQREQRYTQLVKLRETRDTLAAAVQRAAAQGAFEDDRRIAVLKLQDKIKRVDSALTAEAEAQNNQATAVISGAVREMAVLISTWPDVTFRIGSSHVTSDRLYDTPRLIALRREAVCILPMGEQNQPD